MGWLTDLWLVFRAITVVDSYFNRPKSIVACVQPAENIGLTSIPSGNQTWQWEILQKIPRSTRTTTIYHCFRRSTSIWMNMIILKTTNTRHYIILHHPKKVEHFGDGSWNPKHRLQWRGCQVRILYPDVLPILTELSNIPCILSNVVKPYKKNSKFGRVTPPIYCELSDGNNWAHDATLKHPLFYFLKYLMLRSNLFSSTSHPANLLRNLLKSPLQTSCLDWTHGLQTHKQRPRKRSCSHTYCVLKTVSKKLFQKKGRTQGQNRWPQDSPFFPPPYSEFCIAWCHGSQICLFEVFKYIRGLHNWNKKSKTSDSKCDNSSALLRADLTMFWL